MDTAIEGAPRTTSPGPAGRRAILQTAATALAAAAAGTAFGSRRALAAPDAILTETANTAGAVETSLTAALNGAVWRVQNSGVAGAARTAIIASVGPPLFLPSAKTGVIATLTANAEHDTAIYGAVDGIGFGVRGTSVAGIGVEGSGEVGVRARSASGVALEVQGRATMVTGVDAPDAALHVANMGAGVAIEAAGTAGGVRAESAGAALAGVGGGPDGIGVHAESADGVALRVDGRSEFTGLAFWETGEVAIQALGVEGGVSAASPGVALKAQGVGAGSVGVHAESAAGTALKVAGRSDFSGLASFARRVQAGSFAGPDGGPPRFPTAGRGAVPRGARRVHVDAPTAVGRTFVLVILQARAGRAVTLSHVQRPPGGFDVVLTRPAARRTPFGYLVLVRG
jgi:hypothetical protein